MHYLITGITGFVGSHLSLLLHNEGHKLTGISTKNNNINSMKWIVPNDIINKIEFLEIDVLDRLDLEKVFRRNKFDGVFHFAAQSNVTLSFKEPRLTFDINTTGTANIVEAITRYQPNCRLVFASTAEVYGNQAGKLDEANNINPVSPYGISKAAAELVVLERARSLGLGFVVGRGFTSTGPGREEFFAFSSDAVQIARIIVSNKKPVVKVGNLKVKRAVADIRDVVRGYYMLMEKGAPGEVYNVAGPKSREYGEYVNMLIKKSKINKIKLLKDPKLFRSIDIDTQIPVTTKLEKLGWKAEIPIEKTMEDLLNYWIDRVRQEESSSLS